MNGGQREGRGRAGEGRGGQVITECNLSWIWPLVSLEIASLGLVKVN